MDSLLKSLFDLSLQLNLRNVIRRNDTLVVILEASCLAFSLSSYVKLLRELVSLCCSDVEKLIAVILYPRSDTVIHGTLSSIDVVHTVSSVIVVKFSLTCNDTNTVISFRIDLSCEEGEGVSDLVHSLNHLVGSMLYYYTRNLGNLRPDVRGVQYLNLTTNVTPHSSTAVITISCRCSVDLLDYVVSTLYEQYLDNLRRMIDTLCKLLNSLTDLRRLLMDIVRYVRNLSLILDHASSLE